MMAVGRYGHQGTTTRRRPRGAGAGRALACVLAVPVLAVCTWLVAPLPSGATGAGAATVSWREPIVEVASAGGYRGPWRMNESVYDFVDDPTVAITDAGLVAVAWVDQARKDVMFQLYGSDGRPRLDRPVNVSRSPRVFSWLPRIVVAGDDAREVFVLWQEIVFSGGSHGGEIYFARSADTGRTFTRPVNLSNTTAGAGKGRLDARSWHNGSLDLILGAQGELYAAWTEYEGRLWFSRSSDRGQRFSTPVLIWGAPDSGQSPARGPALAAGGHGDVHLAWTVGEERDADIRLAHSRDRGQSFGEPEIVSRSDGHADAPKLAVDGQGTLHLVYAESETGPFGRYEVRYARRPARASRFEAPRVIGRPPDGEGSAHFPALALDGQDAVYALWEIFPERGRRSFGLGVTVSHDGGHTFAPPTTVPGSADPAFGVNGSQQGLLMRKLAVSPSGEIAVVNSTLRTGQSSHIRLFRGTRASAGS